MNLICEFLFVYRYVSRHSFSDGGSPDRRKTECAPLCPLSLCGEPWSPPAPPKAGNLILKVHNLVRKRQ